LIFDNIKRKSFVLSRKNQLLDFYTMKKNIFLNDVLKKMKERKNDGSPVKFNIKVREYNRQNKTGGKLKEYRNVNLVMADKTKKISALKKLQHVSAERKFPNHWKNRTRNIELPNGDIRKINILLITEFNGQKVIY